MSLLDPQDLAVLEPAERTSFRSPIPTRFVASDEFLPGPRTEKQRAVDARLKRLGTELARRQGMTRRRFFATASGMAAAFVARNDVYGPVFGASLAEAATPELAGKPQTIDDLKFANYFKEIYFDSDTKVALISGSGSEDPRDWFLTNEMKADARAKVNRLTNSKRMFSHAIFMPGMPGWMDDVDRAIAELAPDSFKGYTVGDNTNKHLSRHPWRMDDEKLLYPFYEKIANAGLVNVCVHKGLFPPETSARFPDLVPYADVRDVGKAARDWPQLNFIVYHGDLGQIFAQSTVAEPRLCAAMMGMLVKGLGADHVVWGTDAVWTGSPQWQIEALRRLEIPEDMQRKHGFAPLGAADGAVKRAIFGENSARLYEYTQRLALATDRIAPAKATYEREGPGRTNLQYGYVTRERGGEPAG